MSTHSDTENSLIFNKNDSEKLGNDSKCRINVLESFPKNEPLYEKHLRNQNNMSAGGRIRTGVKIRENMNTERFRPCFPGKFMIQSGQQVKEADSNEQSR